MPDLTTEQVARLAGVSVPTIRDDGKFAYGRPAARGTGPDRRRKYYRADDVAAWLDKRAEHAARFTVRDAKVTADVRAGERYRDVAARHGLIMSSVARIAVKAGVRNRPVRPDDLRRAAVAYARAHTFAEAVAKFGVCRRSLFIWAKEYP